MNTVNNILKKFCRYVAWSDEYQICYVSTEIYKNCNKCPFKVIQ